MEYDSTADTLWHKSQVYIFIIKITTELLERARAHDSSKLQDPEKPYFDRYTPILSGLTYGSKKYYENLDKMRPAIDHHQQNNRHHPEYHGEKGVLGMNLIDIIEMLCDWKAATLRHDDGDINRSLKINAKRHNIPKPIVKILENTINDMGW